MSGVPSGFLCVLKPPGMTSSAVVVRVRRKLGAGAKVGHAGTLDPEAAGVLPVMTGRAARLFDYLADKEKTYVAQLVPGYATDTQDVYGRVTAGAGDALSREALERVIPAFTGDILQTPPMYSALKRDGRRLYELARRGETAQVEPRPARIDEIRVLHALYDGSYLLLVRCGRGTYIRTLCHDIGLRAGTMARMGFLLRTASGAFTLDGAHTLEEIDAADGLDGMLLPMDAPLAHLPRVDIRPSAERFARNGNPLGPGELLGAAPEGAPVRLYLEEKFAGVGRMQGGMMRFDVMLLE